ncbi:MAG: cyclic nucleotide-binding domain-containing protein [Pseudomonadota bacterium]
MNEFDFTIPPAKSTYDTKDALKFFQSAGETITVATGKTLFKENSKANALLLQKDKMYYLLEGGVELTVDGNPVGLVRAGELFGEMTLITGLPRTATAKTQTDCRLIMLDKDQLQAALHASPEFGLLLMSVMIMRLRDSITQLNAQGGGSETKLKDSAVFDKKLLKELTNEFDHSARIRYPAGKRIIEEGQIGALMYVVLSGTVEIAVQNNVVGTIGTGGMLGEMALISRAERLASATAITDCELLAISRDVFLDMVSTHPKFAVSLLGAVGQRAHFVASMRT